MSFKKEFIKMLENELENPKNAEEYKEGISKALNIFKNLSYGKEILAFEPFSEIHRESEL